MDENDDVVASYHRCRANGDFVETFYRLFLGKSPAIAKMFANTNFKVQKLMLRESLLEMLCFQQGLKGSREEIEKIARRHKHLHIEPEMYDMWLDALCETVRQHDPEHTDELEQRWRQAMKAGIDVMLAV